MCSSPIGSMKLSRRGFSVVLAEVVGINMMLPSYSGYSPSFPSVYSLNEQIPALGTRLIGVG